MHVRIAQPTLLLLLIAAATVAAPPASPPRFVLVQKSAPACEIVIPSPATAIDRRAAELLQSSVRKLTGATLPIVELRVSRGATGGTPVPRGAGTGRRATPGIRIGFPAAQLPASLVSAAKDLRADGFLVASSGRDLLIVSGGHKGAIYGVVHLLETHFGCRKLSPTVEIFPRRDTLSLGPVLETDNPVNDLRIVNGEFSRDPDYQDWRRLDVTDDVFGKGYYVHTFNRLVPWETYFEGHPEYFALMNGKRVKDQLCLMRPEVLQIAIERLRAEIAAQPDRQVWSVSQNDNASYCQCDECRKVIEEEGSPAGPIIRFVNAVAAQFPDKVISTLAYQYSRSAPRATTPAPNVQIMLCTIELNRSLPIADDPGSRSFLKDIVDWGKISRNIYLWDYTVNFSHHVSPFPNLHVLQPNLQFFVRSGARQHFQQTNTSPGHEFSELKGYLIARLLWNPDVDVNAVMTEFLDRYYGAAGPYLHKYIESLEAAVAQGGERLDIYEPPVAHADGYLSSARVAAYNALFDRAEAAVGRDQAVLERVKVARLPLQYAMLEIGKSDMFGPRGFYVERGSRFEPRPDMRRVLEDFYGTCTRNGVKTLSESGLTPQAYYDATERFIDVQVEGNLAFRKPVAATPPPARKYGKGDVALLTNGVRGANDFKVHWLGWEGLDFDLTVDLGTATAAHEVSIGTLYDPHSWILHPRRITCSVSADGVEFRDAGSQSVEGDQRKEDVTRTFTFAPPAGAIRFVRFHVEGTKQLPAWHASAGGTSWVFVDEIVVR